MEELILTGKCSGEFEGLKFKFNFRNKVFKLSLIKDGQWKLQRLNSDRYFILGQTLDSIKPEVKVYITYSNSLKFKTNDSLSGAFIDSRPLKDKAKAWLKERGYFDGEDSKPHSKEIIDDFLKWLKDNAELPLNSQMADKLNELKDKFQD